MDVILNKNEYYTGLVNFILFMRLYATNTSKKEKTLTDIFCSETLEFGDRKVYPFAELPAVEDYSLTSSLLTDKPIRYTEEFIGAPIKKKIPLSRIEPFLKFAMMGSGGMATFIGYILGLIESAKEHYLYGEILNDLLNWTPTNTTDKEMVQNIPLLMENQSPASEAHAAQLLNQKTLELAWQKSFDDFELYTDIFLDIDNGVDNTRFMSAVNPADLIFIGNAKYLNERVVNLMATLLKSDVIDANFRRPHCIKIPERSMTQFGVSNVVGYVVHRHWYQWFYHFNFMGSFFDPDTLRIKNILHFWYSKGRLKNLPAKKITATYAESPF